MRKLLVLTALMLLATASSAAELTLFDIPLRTASREEIRGAITKAGGKLESSSRDADQYDARSIGLPGVAKLEVVYLENRLVMAQYTLSPDTKKDERLRKMLVTKYGQPGGRGNFDGENFGRGKFRWAFDNNMELVFTEEFFGARYISYVNKAEEARLGKLVKDADKRAAEKEAA